MFREVDEIRMVGCNSYWDLMMCHGGSLHFSLLCCIWKFCVIKKIKLCYFRGQIPAKDLDDSHYLCKSERVVSTHSLFSFLPSFLPFFHSFCFRGSLLHHYGATSPSRFRHYRSHYPDEETETWGVEVSCPQTHVCLSPKSEFLNALFHAASQK